MASRLLAALLAPAAFVAVRCQESCLGDDVSLMQVATLTGKAGRAGRQDPAAISSMADNSGFLCIEGDAAQMPNVVAYTRGSPMAQFNSHMARVDGLTCAARGFTQSVGTDMCQGAAASSTVWVRPGTTAASMQAFAEYVGESAAFNGRMRNLPPEVVDKWVTCLTCLGGTPGEGYRWYGGSGRLFTSEECASNNDEVLAAMRQATPRIGSFVADTGVVCFEGEYQYMVDSLAMVKRTPYRDLFGGEVVEQTCLQRGWDKLRDLVDDCWPLASKNMRTATEDADMGEWVAGARGFGPTLTSSDLTRGLPAGLSANLTACFACQAGGPHRDRGMILVMDGSLSNGGYFSPQCQGFLAEACTTYAQSGAVAPELCAAGLADFTSVYREMPFMPVPTLA